MAPAGGPRPDRMRLKASRGPCLLERTGIGTQDGPLLRAGGRPFFVPANFSALVCVGELTGIF